MKTKDRIPRQLKNVLQLFENTPVERLQELIRSGFLADLLDADITTIDRDSFRQRLGLKPLTPLLRNIGTVKIAATGRLIVKERFGKETNVKRIFQDDKFKDRFQTWFFGKIEESASETTLRYAELTRWDSDASIISEIGDVRETTLAQIYSLLELQKPGEQGAFCTAFCPDNSAQNIFYVRDVNSELRIVCINGRYRDRWEIDAYSFPSRGQWSILSRAFFPVYV